MSDPQLILVIGPCGAGKTTWSRQAYPQHAHPDREELTRSLFATPEQFRFYPWARAVGRRLQTLAVDDLLTRKVPLCVTASGATVADRRPWLELAQRHNTPTHLVRLTTPADVCVARARADPRRPATSRPVWAGMVQRWYRIYEPPTAAEGFTTVTEHSIKQNSP